MHHPFMVGAAALVYVIGALFIALLMGGFTYFRRGTRLKFVVEVVAVVLWPITAIAAVALWLLDRK